MMKHFASGQGSQFPPGKTSGCPSAQGCCKTIRFASLENLGARIRHGGAGRSCPGLLDWPTHGLGAPGSQHHCYIASGVRLGDWDTMNRTRGDTRDEKVSPCLCPDLTGAAHYILGPISDSSVSRTRVWCQEPLMMERRKLLGPSSAQPLMINEQLPLPSLV